MQPNPRALSTLTDGPDDFRTCLPAEPRLASRNAARLARLLNTQSIEELLADHGLRYPLFTMSQNGARLPATRYTYAQRYPMSVTKDLPDPRAIRDRMTEGATLILEQLHRTWRPVADFCRRLSYELGRPVSANSYLTPVSSQGFGLHYDTHGAFILQVEGRKTWKLYRPIKPLPLEGQRWREDMLPPDERRQLTERGADLSYELQPGDVLWLPRGWLHDVFTTGVSSLHLTLAVPELSKHQLAAQLMATLSEAEEFRAELPLNAFASPARAREESEHVMKSFAAWLAQADPADLADSATAALRAIWYPARCSPIAAVLRSDDEIASAAGVLTIREAVLSMEYGPDGRLTLRTGEGEVVLDAAAAGFVGGLLADDDPGPVPVERYVTAAAPDGCQVIRTLLGEGIVELIG